MKQPSKQSTPLSIRERQWWFRSRHSQNSLYHLAWRIYSSVLLDYFWCLCSRLREVQYRIGKAFLVLVLRSTTYTEENPCGRAWQWSDAVYQLEATMLQESYMLLQRRRSKEAEALHLIYCFFFAEFGRLPLFRVSDYLVCLSSKRLRSRLNGSRVYVSLSNRTMTGKRWLLGCTIHDVPFYYIVVAASRTCILL